jgi:hypothetical protein
MARLTLPINDPLSAYSGPRALAAAALCTLYVIDDPADDRQCHAGAGAWSRIFTSDPADQQHQVAVELQRLVDELGALPGDLRSLLTLQLDRIPASSWRCIEDAVPKTIDQLQRKMGLDPADLLAYVVMGTSGGDPWATDFFPTPSCLGHLLAAFNVVPAGGWFLEPTAGTGSMLATTYLSAVDRLGRHGADSISWVGIELVGELATIARLQMVCVGAGSCTWIATGNSMTQDLIGRSRHDGKLKELTFAHGNANPPFNTKVIRDINAYSSTDPIVVPDELLNRRIAVPRAAAVA